jgi:hypothetical protein
MGTAQVGTEAAEDDMTRHEFDFAAVYRLPALAFGVTPRTAWVEVDDPGLGVRDLVVRFGLWRLRTPLANIAGFEETGPYGYFKTVGPPHLCFTDRGVTFATNGVRGLCVRFHTPVPGIDPTGWIRHPGATVTVADPQALAARLGE